MARGINVTVKQKPKILVNQAGSFSRRIEDLTNVDVSNKEPGSVLVYDNNTDKWLATLLLDKQTVNGGNF